MSYPPDEHPPRRKRESLMQQRLRAARGEDPDRDPYDRYDRYDDYEDEPDAAPRPRRAARIPPNPADPYPWPPPPPTAGTGCAQATLYIVGGTLVALLIMLIFFSNALGNIGGFFSGGPQIPAISGPTATPFFRSNTPIVQRIQQLQRLETTSYTIQTVIEAGREGDNVFFDQFERDRILLVARGQVEAGVDLARLTADDVTISPDGQTLTVQLPPVEIFAVTLNNAETRVYDRDTGLFAAQDPNLETQARQEAESRILQSACEDGIMQRAAQDSQRAMEQFLSLLDFAQVEVRAAPTPACTFSSAPPAP